MRRRGVRVFSSPLSMPLHATQPKANVGKPGQGEGGWGGEVCVGGEVCHGFGVGTSVSLIARIASRHAMPSSERSCPT